MFLIRKKDLIHTQIQNGGSSEKFSELGLLRIGGPPSGFKSFQKVARNSATELS